MGHDLLTVTVAWYVCSGVLPGIHYSNSKVTAIRASTTVLNLFLDAVKTHGMPLRMHGD